jgi:hypothetical protein
VNGGRKTGVFSQLAPTLHRAANRLFTEQAEVERFAIASPGDALQQPRHLTGPVRLNQEGYGEAGALFDHLPSADNSRVMTHSTSKR